MKNLPPEIAALIPNGIENLVPRCVICGNPVPLTRARGRAKNTCRPECQVVYQAFHKHLRQSRICIVCLHPSTPQERAEYRMWRKDRGDLRRREGRPKKEKQLDKSQSVLGTP